MSIYVIYALLILFIFSVILGFILHNSRSVSTRASDYFNHLKNKTIGDNQVIDNKIEEKINNQKDESVDDNKKIRNEQTAQYLKLLEMYKNNIYRKQLKENIESIGEDKYEELNNYLSFSELSKLLGIDIEETISFFITEGLVERDHYTLVLTEKGIDMGGKYITHEEVKFIEFPKDIFNKLENKSKLIKPRVKKYKNENEINFWFMIIMIALVYFLFFK